MAVLGQLPTTIEVNGTEYRIRSDFRNVLTIFVAMEDPELSDSEKAYVLLKRIYEDFESIPDDDYKEAYQQAVKFIEAHSVTDDKPNAPVLVNWVKDESLIFSAVNKVAGCEVRLTEYMHWWTFLGYFEAVDHEDLWAFVLSIRQKRAKGKKLEKYERDFYNSNKKLCDVGLLKKVEKPEDALKEMFNSLLMEGGE